MNDGVLMNIIKALLAFARRRLDACVASQSAFANGLVIDHLAQSRHLSRPEAARLLGRIRRSGDNTPRYLDPETFPDSSQRIWR